MNFNHVERVGACRMESRAEPRSRRLSVVRDSSEPSRAQARAEGTGNGLRDGLRAVGEASAGISGAGVSNQGAGGSGQGSGARGQRNERWWRA